MGIYTGKENDIGTTTKFSVGLNGGVKYFLSDIIGIRIMAILNMPITDVSGGFWWSSGGGTSIGLSSNVPFLQFGFMGGLVINLN